MGKRDEVKLPSLLIATFALWKNGSRTASNGIMYPLLYYFTPRTKKLFLLDQPYPGSDRIIPTVEIYKSGKLRKTERVLATSAPLYPLLRVANKPGTHLAFKLRDLLSVIESGLRRKDKVDLFVGLESINAIGGIMLRRFGKVNKVVYYVSDYSPKRFSSTALNSLYLWMDRFAAKHSDYIWDVSLAMHPARISAGLDKNITTPVIHVPNALYKEQIDALPFNKRDPYSIVFVGTLGLENGPDLAISAFEIVLKKFPKASLHIFGGGGKGHEEEYLRKLAKKLNIEKKVYFHGFISDQEELSDKVKHFQISIAPYKKIPGSIRLYGDATKLRLYMASGLPVVSTHVPPLGKELAEKGAAILVKANKDDIAQGIVKVFKDKKLYKNMAESAIGFAKDNLWENTYKRALKKMGYH